MSFHGITNLRPNPAKSEPAEKNPWWGMRGYERIDELECKGCGSTHFSPVGVCLYCKRQNPFAQARQAAKAIEVTTLDDYVPRFVFDGTMTANEAREFASMWMSEQSRPGAIISLPAGMEFAGMQRLQIEPIEPAHRDGAYALKPLPPPSRIRFESDTGRPSLLSRLITRLFR